MRRHEDHEPGQMNTERGPGPIFVGGLKVVSKAGKDGAFSFSRFCFVLIPYVFSLGWASVLIGQKPFGFQLKPASPERQVIYIINTRLLVRIRNAHVLIRTKF